MSEALTVAIASENDLADGELYRFLLERLLNRPVKRWETEIRFDGGGFRRVHSALPLFLELAARGGVDRALVAIDNDGGSQRCPEHVASHAPEQEGRDEESCRVCWLGLQVPEAWKGSAQRACIVVPVQTLETWLLVLKGHDFGGRRPEQTYDRNTLKKRFYGSPLPPGRRRTEMALEHLRRPEALDALRQRPSFTHFAEQLAAW